MVERDILFIYGAPRSGTTYVNTLVRDYFSYGLCAEGQWVFPIGRREASYGDLSVDGNFQRMIDDVREDVMFHHFRTVYAKRYGRPVDVTSEAIWTNLPERSFAGLVYSVFYCVAEQLGTKHVGNKFPGYWEDLPLLKEWFPNAKFLHVVRDGRDVALSLKRRIWGQKTAYAAAQMWSEVQ